MRLDLALAVVLGFCACAKTMSTRDTTKYREMAKQIADKYMADKESPNTGKRYGPRTAQDSLRSFHRPSKRRQQEMKQKEREMVELRSLALLASDGDEEMLRELESLDLFERAETHDFCNMTIDCSQTSNRKFVDNIEFRTADGQCNNLGNFGWGKAGAEHWRQVDNAYRNGIWAARSRTFNDRNANLPGSRAISDRVHNASVGSITENSNIALALFQWGQFLDHDIVATPEGNVGSADCCAENRAFCMPITVGSGDSYFSEGSCMPALRSDTVFPCDDVFQNQYNEVTAYIDASNVYGSSEAESNRLRTFVGGLLRMADDAFPPKAVDGDDFACDEAGRTNANASCLDAGDKRVNVQPGLGAMHVLFVREHNRIAKELGILNSGWSDERIFQETRKIVAAEMQIITYNEFLPSLLAGTELSRYGVSDDYSYNSNTNATIIQSFSIAFRFHNLMPSSLHLARDTGNIESKELQTLWEDPSTLYEHSYRGVDELLLGLATNNCPHASRFMDNVTRNMLFLDSMNQSFDLAALNIERGREWGMPSYTVFSHQVCGFDNVTAWGELTNHTAEIRDILASVYNDPRDIDLWTGLVTETPVGSSLAGPTQSCLVARQFANLKHGDRFWFETPESGVGFTTNQLTQINKVTLAKVICENMEHITNIPKNVFKSGSTSVTCASQRSDSRKMDLSVWSAGSS